MKNFIKYSAALCAFAALLLLGCANPLNQPFTPSAPQQGLQITITGADQGRTLYPQAEFTKYVVNFSGPGSHADIVIPGNENSTTVTGLAAGTWTIIVRGYVQMNLTLNDGTVINDEIPVAIGEETVEVTGGNFTPVVIDLHADNISGGAVGYFSYDITFPAEKAEYALLQLFPWSAMYQFDTNNPEVEAFLVDEPAGAVALDPGFYLMVIRINNAGGRESLVRTEVVHIYSDMDTQAVYTFTEDDFTRFITLSGTADFTFPEPATELKSYYLSAYLDAEYNDYLTGETFDDEDWELSFAASDIPRNIYLRITVYPDPGDYYERVLGPVQVHDQDISGHEIVITFNSKITLSGTVEIEGYMDFSSGYVSAYLNPDFSGVQIGWASVEDNYGEYEWEMEIEGFDASTTVYFNIDVYGYDELGDWIEFTGTGSQQVSTSDVGDIALTVSDPYITLSGTVTLTGDLASSVTDLSINLFTSDWQWLWDLNQYARVDLAAGKWQAKILPYDTPTNIIVQIEAEVDGGSGPRNNQTVTGVYNADKGNIDFTINLTRQTLNGTVSITDNTGLAEYYMVVGYLGSSLEALLAGDGESVGQAEVKDGAWEMMVWADHLSGSTMSFLVAAAYDDDESGETLAVIKDLGEKTLANPMALGAVTFNATDEFISIGPSSGGGDPWEPPEPPIPPLVYGTISIYWNDQEITEDCWVNIWVNEACTEWVGNGWVNDGVFELVISNPDMFPTVWLEVCYGTAFPNPLAASEPIRTELDGFNELHIDFGVVNLSDYGD